MKQFFKTFVIVLLPLLLLVEVFGLILPKNTPYGVFIVGRLVMTAIGTIIAITRLKRKHQQVHFGKSLLAGSMVIFVGFMITTVIYVSSFEEYYRYAMSEVIVSLMIFMSAQISILLSILLMAGKWYAIQKAGQPGYSMLIPIYNSIVLLQIAKKPIWWVVLFFIPIVNIVMMIIMLNGISKQFGKSEGFTVGLVLLGGIFWAVLGYDESIYNNGKDNPRVQDTID